MANRNQAITQVNDDFQYDIHSTIFFKKTILSWYLSHCLNQW